MSLSDILDDIERGDDSEHAQDAPQVNEAPEHLTETALESQAQQLKTRLTHQRWRDNASTYSRLNAATALEVFTMLPESQGSPRLLLTQNESQHNAQQLSAAITHDQSLSQDMGVFLEEIRREVDARSEVQPQLSQQAEQLHERLHRLRQRPRQEGCLVLHAGERYDLYLIDLQDWSVIDFNQVDYPAYLPLSEQVNALRCTLKTLGEDYTAAYNLGAVCERVMTLLKLMHSISSAERMRMQLRDNNGDAFLTAERGLQWIKTVERARRVLAPHGCGQALVDLLHTLNS